MKHDKPHIICSNIHYFYYNIESSFANMRENNLTELELYLGTPHIFIDGNVIDDFNRISVLAAQAGVRVTDVHPETVSFRYHLCSLDREWNESSVNMYRNAILYGAQIGAKSVNTNLTGAFKDQNQNEIFENLVKNLKRLAKCAKEKDIFLTLEAESPRFEGFINSLSQMKELDARINNSALRFGINIDALADAKESVNEWREAFEERIRYMRFSSIESFKNTQAQLRQTNANTERMIFFFNDDRYLARPTEVDKMLKEATNGSD